MRFKPHLHLGGQHRHALNGFDPHAALIASVIQHPAPPIGEKLPP